MGARRVRLTQLMKEHYGKIDIEVAQRVLSDHYDVYLQKDNHQKIRECMGLRLGSQVDFQICQGKRQDRNVIL